MANSKKTWFQPNKDLRFSITSIEIDLGLMAYGVDYLIENNAPSEVIFKYNQIHESVFIRQAAQLINCPESAIQEAVAKQDNLTEREKEYIRRLKQLIAKNQSDRVDKYLHSDFVKTLVIIDTKALSILQEEGYKPGNDVKTLSFDDLPGDEGTELQQALRILNLSFYASHREFNPKESGAIGEEEIALAKTTTEAYIAFHKTTGQPYTESIWEYLDPDGYKTLTEIPQSEFFNEPISKAWRMQNAIALSGAAGFDLNVGKKTKAGKVIIEASISDLQGNPVSIDGVLKGVQRAIGNLIDRNGGIRPIVVTPAQIYRAYAGLPVDSYVSPNQ